MFVLGALDFGRLGILYRFPRPFNDIFIVSYRFFLAKALHFLRNGFD